MISNNSKGNPNHDSDGKFASAGNNSSSNSQEEKIAQKMGVVKEYNDDLKTKFQTSNSQSEQDDDKLIGYQDRPTKINREITVNFNGEDLEFDPNKVLDMGEVAVRMLEDMGVDWGKYPKETLQQIYKTGIIPGHIMKTADLVVDDYDDYVEDYIKEHAYDFYDDLSEIDTSDPEGDAYRKNPMSYLGLNEKDFH